MTTPTRRSQHIFYNDKNGTRKTGGGSGGTGQHRPPYNKQRFDHGGSDFRVQEPRNTEFAAPPQHPDGQNGGAPADSFNGSSPTPQATHEPFSFTGIGLSENHGGSMELAELEAHTVTELHKIASEIGIKSPQKFRKSELILKIKEIKTHENGLIMGEGILDIVSDGFGFLRRNGFTPGPEDIYVSISQSKRFGLRPGDVVMGQVRPPKENERYFSLLRVEAVNGMKPDESKTRRTFEDQVPIYPNQRLNIECEAHDISTRIIDLIAPIGRGQRALIVAPPKAGKTILLKKIANSITTNHPDMILMALLIDERPEEVTDFRRSVKGDVISSTFDEKPENHTAVAQLVLSRAKRLVEMGNDVVILMDSITRLARAYNLTVPPSGRTLSGGLDPNALHKPKRFFGAARKLEKGGSLTVVATALIETGSRLDEVIFEEFKGTGNMELQLSRTLADKRIFPAIDIVKSGTRHEELLYSKEELDRIWKLRRIINTLDEAQATELVIERLTTMKTNEEFLKSLQYVSS